MMAPVPVVGRAKLYKTSIERLMQWLAKTAAESCDITSISRPDTDNGAGRSRRGPRQQHTQAIKIYPKHLAKLAKAATSAQSPVAIPPELVRLVEELAAGMHSCSEWYDVQSIPAASEVGGHLERHAELTLVLDEALHFLTSAGTTNRTNTSRRPVATGSLPTVESLNTILSSLPTGVSCGISSKQSPRIEVKLEDDNVAFEIWCHLQDLHDIRVFARDTWTDYSKGNVSLIAAGVVTDGAFGLMRKLDAEFTATVGRFRNYFGLLSYLGMDTDMLGDLVILSPKNFGWQKNAMSSVSPIPLLCPAAGELLRSFAYELVQYRDDKHFQPPDLMDIFFGPPPPFTNHMLGPILFAHIPRIDNHACRTKKERKRGEHCDVPADEFLRGLLNLCSNISQGVPVWLVVACQTYMDVFDIIGKDVYCGANMLVESRLETMATLEEYEECRESPGIAKSTPTPSSNEHFRSVMSTGAEVVSWVHQMRDAGQSGRTRLINNSPLGAMPLELVLELPVMPCVMLYTSQVHDCVNGVLMTNDGLSTLALGHLYRAMQYYGLVDKTWEDMEFVLKQYGAILDPGSKATDQEPYAILRSFRSALGMPESSLATEASYLPPAGIIPKKASKFKATSDLMDSLVVSTHKKRKPCISTEATIDIARSVLANKKPKTTTKPRPVSGESGINNLTPLQILHSFRESLTADEPQLNFNVVSFSQSCAGLLEEVKAAVLSQLPEAVAKNIRYDYQLVDLLLWEAANMTSEGLPLADTQIERAATVLLKITRGFDRSLVMEAHERSSGHIPAYLCPQLRPKRSFGSVVRRIRKITETAGFRSDGDRLSAGLYDPSGKMDEVGPEVCKLAMALKALIKADMNMARVPPREQERLRKLFQNGGIDARNWTLEVALAALSVESQVPKEAMGIFAGVEVQNMAVVRRK